MELVDPIDRIEWRPAAMLKANAWNPNRVHKPELRLLERSILETGWMQPILVNADGVIIDGFHRWRLALDSKKMGERWHGRVPCVVLDIPEDEAMATTVRINRAKGSHVAVEMHRLVATLITEYGWDRKRVAQSIGASLHEVDTLAQDGIFAIRQIDKWAYSQAWYPQEGDDPEPEVEREDDE